MKHKDAWEKGTSFHLEIHHKRIRTCEENN
jgi:hypothetical protein